MAYDEYSHFVQSRTALWCPICGAAENKGCTEVKGLRFQGHNGFALGAIRPAAYTQPFETPAFFDVSYARKDKTRVSSGLRGWVN